MKQIIISMAMLCLLSSIQAQQSDTPSVEKSQWGLQLGLLEFNAYNENKLTSSLVLRTELSARASYNSFNGVGISPVITVGPRWYYNLKNRAARDKVTANNSANFLALEVSQLIAHYNFRNPLPESPSYTTAIVKWGLRRNINDRFLYEIGLGVGTLLNNNPKAVKRWELTQDLDLRVGYRF